MITGISSLETKDFVSSFDKGEDKTIFKIAPLTSSLQIYISKMLSGDASNSIEAVVEAFKFGVKDIINLKDSSGNFIKFETLSKPIRGNNYNAVSDKIIELLPLNVLSEVGAAILKIGNLEDDETKN